MDRISKGLEALTRLNADRASICLPLAVVSELSDWLKNEYGICHVESLEQMWLRLQEIVSRAEYKKISKMFAKRYTAAITPQGTAHLDPAFYEYIAHDPLSGWVLSERRGFILDAAAFVTAILRATACAGPILDVGCNVGYHAAWIARHLSVPVLGIDRSANAIKYAQAKTKDNKLCKFQRSNLTDVISEEGFDCIYAAESLADDVGAFVVQVDSLAQGGL